MNKNLWLLIGVAGVVAITITVLLLHKPSRTKIKYVWNTASPDPGTTCSVPCGGGKRYLKVWCENVDSSGKNVGIVDDSMCDQSSKPSGVEDCNTQACS
jgi:hypothetical protein